MFGRVTQCYYLWCIEIRNTVINSLNKNSSKMKQIIITIDGMYSNVTRALILQELADVIKECDVKELNRENNNWHAEYCSMRVRTVQEPVTIQELEDKGELPTT